MTDLRILEKREPIEVKIKRKINRKKDGLCIEIGQTQPPSNYACEYQMRFYFSLFSHTFFFNNNKKQTV